MKRQVNCFVRRFPLCVLLPVLSLAGGCSSSGNREFETVAGFLDTGGSFYRISDTSCLQKTTGAFLKSLEKALLDGADGSRKTELMTLLPQVELAGRLAGISECRWTGTSSRKIPDLTETTYQNKSFYLLPENPKGILWQLPGNKNRPVLGEIAQLSAETIFAGDFILDLRSPGKTLAQSLWGKEKFELLTKAWLNMTLVDFLDCVSGEWGVVLFALPEDEKKLDMVVTFPDRGLRVFKGLSRILKNFPGCAVKENNLTWKGGDGVLISCIASEDRITVFTSPEAREKFLFPKTKLASQPEFKRLSSQMPEEGLGIFYSAGAQPETTTYPLPKILGSGVWDPAVIDRPQLTVLRREEKGISIISNGSFDAPTEDIVNYVMLPAVLVVSHWEEYSPLLKNISGEQKKQAQKQKVVSAENTAPAGLKGCQKKVAKLAAGLKAYARKNKGAYPAEMDLAGIKKILSGNLVNLNDLICPGTADKAVASAELLDFNSCSYIYFGAWAKGADGRLPLLIDRPGNHKEYFHVVFNDGKVELLKLENNVSVKRIAGFLHTKYNYSEEEFRELIKRSAQLDALFEAR